MEIQVSAGQTVTKELYLLDQDTNLEVGGWFTGVSASSDNNAIATAVPNISSADGRLIDFKGVGQGTANITVNATANYVAAGVTYVKALQVSAQVVVPAGQNIVLKIRA
jgi:hypothetical protein